ncbi:hypothetical protein DBV15_08264 [Temnothorax longispinosus]|uniref:Uncharacterized protein n=1 Tax=Temnothorax longispinosus TaxID=300112 RepID=A0A4S2KJD0_9HYME|nr:hypothetical protein DBV15_08264 [Temnothorax longispinosus]
MCVISVLANNTDKEDDITKVKIQEEDSLRDHLTGILLYICAVIALIVLFCIYKVYDFIRIFYIPFKNLWRYFVFWFFRVILRTPVLEIPVRIQVLEMELIYIGQRQEEIQNNDNVSKICI